MAEISVGGITQNPRQLRYFNVFSSTYTSDFLALFDGGLPINYKQFLQIFGIYPCWRIIYFVQLNSSMAMWQVLYDKMWEVTHFFYLYMTTVIVPGREYSIQPIIWMKIMWNRVTRQLWWTWKVRKRYIFVASYSFGDHQKIILLPFFPVIFNSSCYFLDISQIFWPHWCHIFPRNLTLRLAYR